MVEQSRKSNTLPLYNRILPCSTVDETGIESTSGPADDMCVGVFSSWLASKLAKVYLFLHVAVDRLVPSFDYIAIIEHMEE